MREVRSLEKLDPHKAALSNALLRLLFEESGRVTASVMASEPADFNAFVVNDACAFVVCDGNGLSGPEQADDVDQACDMLDLADGLLKFAEGRLGIDLNPVAIVDAQASAFTSADAVVIYLQSEDTEVRLALIADNAQQAHWLAAVHSAPADFPCLVTFEFEAARLPVASAAHIGGGDLLLLVRKVAATLSCEPAALQNAPQHGVIDLAAAIFSITDRIYDEKDSSMGDDDRSDQIDAGEAGNATSQLMVPVTVRLPAQHFSAAALAALGQGSTLPLAPIVQGLQVELLVGGRKIANGEIVEIGDNFAILIGESTRTSSPIQSPGLADPDASENGAE